MTAPASMTIPLKTLTPIHTGDADMKTSYLRATSLLGGLRFWTEALLRSFGEDVCSISDGENRCLYDGKKKHACAACKIFGCTGLGRSFIMRVEHVTNISSGYWPTKFSRTDLNELCQMRNDSKGYFRKEGMDATFDLRLVPARPAGQDKSESHSAELAAPLLLGLHLLLKYGTLGAQDQYGMGLVACTNPGAQGDLQQSASSAVALASNSSLPGLSLSDFFFFTGSAPKHDERIPFAVRCNVRNNLREKNEDLLRHYFCGTFGNKKDSKDSKQATKYNITMHSGRISGWGWFPKQGPHGDSRDRCLDVLHKQVQVHAQELQWCEFDSPRDPASKGLSWQEYLGNLVTADWPR